MNKKEYEFNSLIEKHKRTFSSVIQVCAKNEEESEALMLEVIIKLWNDYDTFRENCNDRNWLWRTAMNICTKYICRRRIYGAMLADSHVSGTWAAEDDELTAR